MLPHVIRCTATMLITLGTWLDLHATIMERRTK